MGEDVELEDAAGVGRAAAEGIESRLPRDEIFDADATRHGGYCVPLFLFPNLSIFSGISLYFVRAGLADVSRHGCFLASNVRVPLITSSAVISTVPNSFSKW